MMFSLPQRGGWLVHVPSDRQETEYRRPDIFRQISGQVYSTTSPSWNDVPFCQLIELLLNLELAVIPGNGQRPIPQTIHQRHTKTVKTTSRILRSSRSAPEWANFPLFLQNLNILDVGWKIRKLSTEFHRSMTTSHLSTAQTISRFWDQIRYQSLFLPCYVIG